MINSYSPGVDELGNQLGELKSTSETFQMIVLGGFLVAGIASSFVFFAGAPLVGLIFGAAIVAGLVSLLAKRVKTFSTRMSVFDKGMEISVNGKEHRFLFSQVDQYSMQHTNHYSRVAGKEVYLGTRVVTQILLESKFSAICCDCEYHQQQDSFDAVKLAGDKLCEAVELKLAKQLEANGEIQLTPDVFMTMDGLRIVDTLLDSERDVLIEEIESWQPGGDNHINLFKTGSGLPFVSLAIDGANFVPAFSLFTKLHQRVTTAAAAA